MKNLQKTLPTILTCMSGIGVIATAVMAVKETPKAIKICDELKQSRLNDCQEEPNKYEYAKAAWSCYVPALLVGVSTISCVFGACVLSKRNQASIASAYALLSESYKRYRKAANSVYGEDADSKIKAQVAKEQYISGDGSYLYYPDNDTDNEKVLFYDSFSQRYFKASLSSVINAEYHVNRNLALRGDVSVNEFYEFLGIDKIAGGDSMTWSLDEFYESGIMWLDFENLFTKMDDGMECYVISALYDPTNIHLETVFE